MDVIDAIPTSELNITTNSGANADSHLMGRTYEVVPINVNGKVFVIINDGRAIGVYWMVRANE
jgi:hypothetical protein